MARFTWAAIIAIVALVAAFLLLIAPSWFWHPLGYCVGGPRAVRDCKGYNSWSGSFSDISEVLLFVSFISALVAARQFLHAHFECHEETCHKLGFHHVLGTHYRTCWHHNPALCHHEKHGASMQEIQHAHDRAQTLMGAKRNTVSRVSR